MPAMNAKNMSLSPAATDLGFGGDLLRQQLTDLEEERKRKLLEGRKPAEYGDSVLGPATNMLFGGLNPQAY